MGSCAILRDGETLAEIAGYAETPYNARLFRDVSLLQERANFRIGQVDLFAVAAGPGSFTGLRVGLTAVKAWSEVYGKPVAGVSGLEAIAFEGLLAEKGSDLAQGFLAPFLDARRGHVFGAIYQRVSGDSTRVELAGDEAILPVSEFLELVKRSSIQPPLLVSPTPEALPASQIGALLPGAAFVQVSAALAPAIGKLGLKRFQRGELVDSLRLDANYIRRSDAEAAWKGE